MSNVHLNALEHEDSIKFMHNVKQGAASKSYGLQVAALAGVPKNVIINARRKLAELEQQSTNIETTTNTNPVQTDKTASPQLILDNSEQALFDALDQIAADDLSPKQALDFVYLLKSLRQRQ